MNEDDNELEYETGFLSDFCKHIEQIAKQSLPSNEQMSYILNSTNQIVNTARQVFQQFDFQKIFDSILPPMRELSKQIRNEKDNSDSLLNYLSYIKKLADYYWVIPYNMDTSILKDIFDNVKSEVEFDNYMEKYFNENNINCIFTDIELKIQDKHKEMLDQVKNSFMQGYYALINNAIISIIDDEISFYTKNKQDTLRKDIFIPIINDLRKAKVEDCNWINIVYLRMLNNNINTLFDKINFNNIKINTNKSIRRHCSQHGKKYSNNKIDSLMLINTLYHLLYIKDNLKAYENKLKILQTKNKAKQYTLANNKKAGG